MKLIIFSISLVMVILLSLSGKSLYDYATFVIPLKAAVVDDRYSPHVDSFSIDKKNQLYPLPIKNMSYNNHDKSVVITFKGNDFTLKKTFHVNQTFLVNCDYVPDTPPLDIFKFKGTKMVDEKERLIFLHYVAKPVKHIPCIYPNVILHSIDNVKEPID